MIAEEFKQVQDIEITERVLQDGLLITRVYNPRKRSRGVTDEEQYATYINNQLQNKINLILMIKERTNEYLLMHSQTLIALGQKGIFDQLIVKFNAE